MTYAEPDSKKSEAEAKVEVEKNTKKLFKIKTWYLAPVSLKNLPKKALGIEFTEDSFQQIAIQTENEIWIDANLFSQMSPSEKAKLFMHEVVMSIYLFKFYSIEDFCKWDDKVNADDNSKITSDYFCNNAEYRKFYENIIKPEPVRTLNGNDYYSIRDATAFLVKNQEKLNEGMWERKLKSLSFAKYFTPYYNKTTVDNKNITYEEIRQMFEAGKVTNKLPTECHFVEFKEVKKCSLEFNFKKSELELKINDTNGNFIKAITISVRPTHTVNVFDTNQSILFLSGNWNDKVIGTSRSYFEINFNENGIQEIAIKFQKLISHIENLKEVDGKKQLCTTTRYGDYNPKTLEENTVFINHGNLTSNSLLLNHPIQSRYEDCVDVANPEPAK